MTSEATRTGRAQPTRELILTAAERLFAEHGVLAVSNRQISEAAGQGNNTAVSYHFGTKADLVRAIARKHSTSIEEIRRHRVTEAGDSSNVRDWIACLVSPVAEHLEAVGSPTWFARFGAQVMTDPTFRPIMIDESLSSPSLMRILESLNRCLPDMPPQVRAERADMARQLIVHVFGERERSLAEDTTTPRHTWNSAAAGLIDALAGMWLAPISPTGQREKKER
ncbi:TetR/AcrR family transcriptional regulator [Lentzea californiensis]|uniref:TetR/AcrR family transcriptional regulator n=1 Tax=Lentzea californiensis TaxID=438851 RepID=UPI002166687B|nr:TetR/AcrR family transcriptional regulator [Lentzea californiensis]MCR3750774.1 transcriptional regulator, TetR family [Lentzea californiensis]